MGKFYKIDTRGKHWLQRVASAPVHTAADEGRMIYDQSAEEAKIGKSNEWSSLGSYNDVPLNTILLIESDTQLVGYTLLTNKNDMTVYISSGSGAGGEAGGSDKSGGTWTQPNHTHTVGSHTHTVASHTHTVASGTVPGVPSHTHGPGSGAGNFMTSSFSTHGRGGDSYGTFANTDTASGGGSSHNHGGVSGSASPATGNNTAFTVGNSATANSWRPTGRNFTRQRRS